MSQFLARAVLPSVSGIAADESVNDLAFTTTSSVGVLSTAVETFFTHVYSAGESVGSFLSPDISRVTSACSVEIYDIAGHLDGSPHGSPISIVPFTMSASLADPSLPEQVAVTLSMHASYGLALEHGPTETIPTDHRAQVEGAPSTHTAKSRPRSSLRGRIFIGPLNTGAIGATVGNSNVDLQTTLKDAAVALLASEPGWSVWSRRLAALNAITGGWIDADLSVIRRRKLKTPVKVVWP